MIGYVEDLPGQFGNQLLQYLFLRELSAELSTSFFHREIAELSFFQDIAKKRRRPWIARKRVSLSIDFFLRYSVAETLGSLRELIARNEVVLNPPMLGLTFAYSNNDPNRFLKLKDPIRSTSRMAAATQIVVHFRGKDFRSWNEKAILSTNYYLRALETVLDRTKEISIALLFDDPELESLQAVKAYLRDKGIAFTLSGSLIEDFRELTLADIVISSPSTFAIAGSMIGKRGKTIIHSEEWVKGRISVGDKIWMDMVSLDVPWYKAILI